MAAGFASPLLKWTAEKLSSLIPAASSAASAAAGSSSDPHRRDLEDLRMLERTMRRIQAKLDDAEERDIRDNLEKLHLEELKGVAYDAEDVVDEYEYEVLQAKAEARRQRSSSSSGKRKLDEEVCELDDLDDDIHALTVPVPDDLAIEVKEIRNRFDEITKDWDALRWREGDDGPRRRDHYNSWKPQPTCSLVHEPNIHGREKDKQNIKKLLLNDNECSAYRLSVIPIIGMGGIGKTTLAQLIYNDPDVCQYFAKRGWVCVSDDFDILGLTRKIFESITGRECKYTELNEIASNLKEVLKGKRFLLILDDVWNEKPILWRTLRDFLLVGESGKVIVTTRNESTARIMQTLSTYRLEFLSFDDCWSIFHQLAFEGRDSGARPELVEIGQNIVMKCKGLPLAVKALGGILRFEADEEKWTNILESELWDLDEGKDEILPALRLSYERMAPVVKQCFKFFSLFPKDYVFKKDNVVRMWMSQGLLRSEGKKQPEDIGSGYLENFLQRSILQQDPAEPKYIVMHDLIHDVAQSVAGKEYLRLENNVPDNLSKEVRHLSMVCSKHVNYTWNLQPLQKLKALRMFILVHTHGFLESCDFRVDMPNDLFQNMKRLRTLSLNWTIVKNIPNSMCNLKLLRYLDINFFAIERIPDWVLHLYNLQTLDMKIENLVEVPDIQELTNLRHLDYKAACMPRGIRYLTNLQTLPFIQGVNNCRHFRIQDLKNLNHLRGDLRIVSFGSISGKDAREVNLKSKEHIKNLFLIGWGPRVDNQSEKQALRNLQPHTNLTSLHMDDCLDERFPSWVGDVSFSKLVSVTLSYCYCASLPSLGQLPSLKTLNISWFWRLRYIGREFYGGGATIKSFPSLENLEFQTMLEWVEWGGGEDDGFPCLQKLVLVNCKNLHRLPQHLSSSLSTLNLFYCRNLEKLPSLPSLTYLVLEGNINKMILSSCHLPLLRTLEISRSQELFLSIDYRSLHSLKELHIWGCSNLKIVVSLPDLTSLKVLKVACSPQVEFRLRHATGNDDSWLPVIVTGTSPHLQEYCRSRDIELALNGD